jgi:hypothetical protein
MSNAQFELAAAVVSLAQVVALLYALFAPRGMWVVLLINLLFGAAVLIYLAPSVPVEWSHVASGEASELVDYKVPLVCLFELVVLVAAGLRLCGRRVPGAVIWSGFAINFCFSLLVLVYAFTFEFRCCGYL